MISNIASVHEGIRHRIKDSEKALIYQEIFTAGSCSRRMIIDRLRLRPATVSKIVTELIADQLVFETEERISDQPGRPQVLLRPNPDRLAAITIHVQARTIRAALININEVILKEYSCALPADASNDQFLQHCTFAVNALSADRDPECEILGVALSLVGTVNARKQRWLSAARWRKLKDIDFGRLEAELGLPVILNRIQDAELRYFIQKNPSYRTKNLLFIHWGFGIGAAYADNGRVLGSSLGRYCEIGHTRVSDTANKQCQCGAYGCLETVAALWAIQQSCRHIPSGVTDERILATRLRDANLNNDPVIDSALKHLQLALLNMYQILYPDVVLFMGPLVENQPLFKTLTDHIRSELPEYARNDAEFIAIPGGYGGAILGSVYPFFLKRLGELLRTTSF